MFVRIDNNIINVDKVVSISVESVGINLTDSEVPDHAVRVGFTGGHTLDLIVDTEEKCREYLGYAIDKIAEEMKGKDVRITKVWP